MEPEQPMTAPTPSSPTDFEHRLQDAERQLQNLRSTVHALVWFLAIVILAALIPPLGAVIGLALAILVIIVPLLLFIYFIIWLLDRATDRRDPDG
jgi:Flp pilus assembly protein TadB